MYLLVLGVSLKVSGRKVVLSCMFLKVNFETKKLWFVGKEKGESRVLPNMPIIVANTVAILIMSICKGYFAPPVSTFLFFISFMT